MKGSHAARTEPEAGKTYAFLIDVAGQDEARTSGNQWGIYEGENEEGGSGGGGRIGEGGRRPPLQNPGRDSTLLKVVEVDMSTVGLIGKPSYLTVFRKEWKGESHVTVFGALRGLAKIWKPMRIVIDATGVGEGLWSLLDNLFGSDMVIPVKFTAKVKSELGYGFIGIVESGRYREYHPFPDSLRIQLDKCRSEIVAGPAKSMRWGVPDGTRDEASGELVHDDDLMTGAMCSLLDRMEWYTPQKTGIVRGRDPLEGMDRAF
jgi:hypothetical protein